MPYLNILESSLSIGIGRVLGRIKADLKIKIKQEINLLEQSITDNCQNTEELEKIKPLLQNLQKILLNYRNRLLKIQNITTALAPTLVSLNVILRILLTLPIPNTTTTAGSVVTLGNQLHRVKELAKQLQDDIGLVNLLVVGSSNGALQGISTLLLNTENSLNRISNLFQTCIKESTISEEIPPIQDDNKSTSFQEKEKYTSTKTGETYELEVIVVDNTQIAPLRQALAKDLSGKIRYESDKSYSSSTQVLIDQVKYKIESNIN